MQDDAITTLVLPCAGPAGAFYIGTTDAALFDEGPADRVGDVLTIAMGHRQRDDVGGAVASNVSGDGSCHLVTGSLSPVRAVLPSTSRSEGLADLDLPGSVGDESLPLDQVGLPAVH